MSLPKDTWTTTEDGAAAYERLRGHDEDIGADRPTAAELEAEEAFWRARERNADWWA